MVKIIPAKIWRKYSFEDWETKEDELIKVVSGPYKLEKKYKNPRGYDVFEFAVNEFYSPTPYIKKIYFYFYLEINIAYSALKIKEINSLGGLKPSYLVSALGRSNKIELIIFPRIIGVFFNEKKFNQEELKKIKNLAKMIDRNYIIENIFEKMAEPSKSIFSPKIQALWGLKEEENLKQIGNFDLSIELIVPDNFLLQKIGEYLQKNFNFKITSMSLEKINNEIIPQKEYSAILYGISYNLLPDLRLFFDPDSIYNLSNTNNKDILRIIQDVETGPETEIYENLAKLKDEINKLPVIFLVNPYYIYILPKDLKGFDTFYLNDSTERFVKIEKWYIKEKIKWQK